jgi:hypothetical protein
LENAKYFLSVAYCCFVKRPVSTHGSCSAQEKERRKENTKRFLDGIRRRLDTVVHQLALSPAEAAVACGHWPGWAYQKIYRGEWRVIDQDGNLRIPRSEIERDLGGAKKYAPKQKRAKNGGAK